MEDKYIGLLLAISSSAAIGTSFIITKKGLMDASDKHGFAGDNFTYLRSPLWWAGMLTMALGEIANFAAYTFAPAILVTPLGALSVLIGAVLAAIFLKEELGILGKLGCAICLLGSVVIVLHAPADKDIQTVDEILNYAIQPGFLLYCISVAVFVFVMIYRIAPRYGKKNPLVYISICSTVGSVSVMAIKGFGIAVKLTFAGFNQFTHPSTYVFAIVTAGCIVMQMNYFNKALNEFSTSLVNPLYYVTFTTMTLCASFILFRGFNTTNPINTISLLCGFLVIFSGVYLLNVSRIDPNGLHLLNGSPAAEGIPMDNGVLAFTSRRSMQARRSSVQSPRSPGRRAGSGPDTGLMSGYEEDSLGLDHTMNDDDNDDGEEISVHPPK
jgi:uncharacterized membrane protein